MPKIVVSVIVEDGTTEIRWGQEEPSSGRIQGYVLVHEDGTLTVPFRDDEDEPFVFVLSGNHARVVASEDQPPGDEDIVVWADRKPL